MINPNVPNMPNIPGMGAMTDSLEFVKNLWGNMGIPGMNMPGANMAGMKVPGMVMPTLSVEEINKKISDLKAVESWLGVNMNMLRGTIQALEVQAATIATLQTMGESFSKSMTPGAGVQSGEPDAAPASNGADGAHRAEKLHGAPEPTSRDESDAANLTAPLVNAAAWWNMLQDQFKQAVSSAMIDAPTAAASAAGKPKAKAASATARKPKTAK